MDEMRRRLTEVFLFLQPLRIWQKKKCFYFKLSLDRNRYASFYESELPNQVCTWKIPLLNERSGCDMQFQYNKVDNLKIASKTVHRLILFPNEVFSFWERLRYSSMFGTYKDGLVLQNGKLTNMKGGGLCQLSELLYYLFLHSPLTILERHPHKVLSLPPLDPEEPYGLDATVYEGWLDLKAKNNTTQKYQILITFDEKYIYGTLCTDGEILYSYEIYNRNVVEFQKEGRSFIKFEVWRRKKEKSSLETIQDEFLYSQEVELTYKRTTSISRMY